jgi:hypothetical protein
METCYDARRIVVKSSVQRDGVDVFIPAASAECRSQTACSMTLSGKPNVSGLLRLESGVNDLDTRIWPGRGQRTSRALAAGRGLL